MGDISKNFSRWEFECTCKCGFNTVDIELIKVLEDLREFFNNPIKINSACRCEKKNSIVGGVKNSKHRLGIASDIVVKNVLPTDVAYYLKNKYPDKYGIGLYQTFCHLDIRQEKARWSK